jgi:hypothetical protein
VWHTAESVEFVPDATAGGRMVAVYRGVMVKGGLRRMLELMVR